LVSQAAAQPLCLTDSFFLIGDEMRGCSGSGEERFSFVRLEEPVPSDQPLRVILGLADEVLAGLSGGFSKLYAATARPSIPPEMLLRATLSQALCSVRSELMVMEQINYNPLFRWLVGLSIDAPVWHPTGFPHNRDRLLQADVAQAFLRGLLALKQTRKMTPPIAVNGSFTAAYNLVRRPKLLTQQPT
jgi:transposase